MQSGAVFFPVALLGLVVLTIFSYYIWFWKEFSVLTSHTTILILHQVQCYEKFPLCFLLRVLALIF